MVYERASMNLAWTLNRLRSMEPAEVLHRLREKARQVASRTRHEGWERYPGRELRTVFPALTAAIGGATPEQRQAIVTAANDMLAGRFAALGQRWPDRDPSDLWPAEAWRFDPAAGDLWPDAYAFDIDFRNATGGDIKYVWEFNRLQQLPVLAAFAVLEDNVRAVAAIEMAVQSWHAANPPFRGIAWASGIEVALRAISLILTLDIAGTRIGAGTRKLVAEILEASAFWLPRFPSHFSSANNHLVAELAGEYLIALARGGDETTPRRELIREISLQILPDGSGAEQTPTYAAFTAEMALLCLLAARSTPSPFPAEAEERLARFAEFVDWLGPVRFGDDDEGRALTLGYEDDYAASVAAAIRGTLHLPGPAAAADDVRALVFGTPAASTAPVAGLRTFPDGGLSLWHGEIAGRHIDLSFDHGPLGYLSIAAHGHADALSVTLALDGQPVLVDPGTYLYGSGGAWRRWFRSTPAHNTLNIEGESQSIMSGAFNWSHKAKAMLEESRPGPDWKLRASHDGYLARFGGIHERSVELTPDGIRLTDHLLRSHHVAEIVFQLAPGLLARADGRTVTVRDASGPLLLIQFPNDAIVISVARDSDPASGWVSPRFGVRKSALRLAWRGIVDQGGVETLLKPVRGHNPAHG
jgi:hypothetical protein